MEKVKRPPAVKPEGVLWQFRGARRFAYFAGVELLLVAGAVVEPLLASGWVMLSSGLAVGEVLAPVVALLPCMAEFELLDWSMAPGC